MLVVDLSSCIFGSQFSLLTVAWRYRCIAFFWEHESVFGPWNINSRPWGASCSYFPFTAATTLTMLLPGFLFVFPAIAATKVQQITIPTHITLASHIWCRHQGVHSHDWSGSEWKGIHSSRAWRCRRSSFWVSLNLHVNVSKMATMT